MSEAFEKGVKVFGEVYGEDMAKGVRAYSQQNEDFGNLQAKWAMEWAFGTVWTREELETDDGFARFVQWRLDRARDDAPRPSGHVPCTFYWVVDDADPETYLGSISVRHSLTPFLLEVGGHIGYSVRPSARRRGVATEALRLVLPHAAALGIDPALLTCDVDNAGSAAVIEANGGVLEDVRGVKRRYWVPTGALAPRPAFGGPRVAG